MLFASSANVTCTKTDPVCTQIIARQHYQVCMFFYVKSKCIFFASFFFVKSSLNLVFFRFGWKWICYEINYENIFMFTRISNAIPSNLFASFDTKIGTGCKKSNQTTFQSLFIQSIESIHSNCLYQSTNSSTLPPLVLIYTIKSYKIFITIQAS